MVLTIPSLQSGDEVFVNLGRRHSGLVFRVLTALQHLGITPNVFGGVPAPSGTDVTNVYLEARNDLRRSRLLVDVLHVDRDDCLEKDWTFNEIAPMLARGSEVVLVLVSTPDVLQDCVHLRTLTSAPGLSVVRTEPSADLAAEVTAIVLRRLGMMPH